MSAVAELMRIEKGFSPVCDYYFSHADNTFARESNGWEVVTASNQRPDERLFFKADGRVHSGANNILMRRVSPEKIAAREAAEEKAANQRDEKS